MWGSGRRLASARQTIRITHDTSAIVNGTTLLTDAQRTVLLNNILPSALGRITGYLQVDPVVGNLLASRTCTKLYSAGTTYAGKCAGYATTPPLCSPANPTITIPNWLLGTNCTNYSSVRRLAAGSCCRVAWRCERTFPGCGDLG